VADAGAVNVHPAKLGPAAAQVTAIEIPAEDGVRARQLAIENVTAVADADVHPGGDLRVACERIAHAARRYIEDLVDVGRILDVKVYPPFVQRNSSCSG
jgi:hypothetical protein